MKSLLSDGQYVLAAWQEQLVSSRQVVSWADRAIEEAEPGQIPPWLFDLSGQGPEVCLKRPSYDFVDVPDLEFAMRLAIRAAMLDPTNRAQVTSLVHWLSRTCIGEDLSRPEVQFGYQVDHLWADCGRLDLAQELVREQLPAIVVLLPPIPPVLREMLRESDGPG
jgi:hypothetical protein